MDWVGRLSKDAAERLGYDQERLRRERVVDFNVAYGPKEAPPQWAEFWMGHDPDRKVRYTLRPCTDCGDGMVFTLAEPS